MTERWLPVPGWEGLYEVSDLGRVRSLDRVLVNSLGIQHARRGRVLRWITSNGPWSYPTVNLRDKATDRCEMVKVHHLVILAFVGPRPDGAQVRHLDGDYANPRLENLAYGTPAENTYDSIAHGTHPMARKTHCKRNHPLSGPNLYVKPSSGQRVCRTCERERQQIWQPLHRAALKQKRLAS